MTLAESVEKVMDVMAGTKKGIVFERSEQAIREAIDEFTVTRGKLPDVIMVPLPLISEAFPGLTIDKVAGIPVSICPSSPVNQIFVTDLQTFCNVKQREKEEGYLNEH